MIKKYFLTAAVLLMLNISVDAQWSQLPNLSKNVISVFVSGNNLLAGTDSGMRYSTDNGNSWNTSSGINTYANSFARDGNKLLVSSYEKLWQSTNNGVSWTALPTIYTFQGVNNIAIKDTHYVAGLNGSGIWYSSDHGTSWTSISTSWQGRNTDMVFKKDMMFASYQGSGFLQKSTNFGKTWNESAGHGIKIRTSSSYQDIYCLAVKNDSVLIAGTKNGNLYSQYDGVYFSNNDGTNWTQKTNGITTTAMNSLAVAGNVIFAGTDGGGVFYTTDEGSNWTALNNGLSNLTINKLYISGATLYAGVSNGMFKIDICDLLKKTSTIRAVGDVIIQSGDSTQLLANTGGVSYQWFLQNSLISNSTSNSFYAKASGNYRAVISYSTNCYDTTNSIGLNYAVGINNNLLLPQNLKLYPNPSNGTVTFEYTIPHNSVPFEIRVYNGTGALVKSIPVSNSNSHFTIDGWPAGIYYAVIGNSTAATTPQKFVVVK